MSDELHPDSDTPLVTTARRPKSSVGRKWLRASVAALSLALPLVVYCCCKAIRREPGLEVITIPSGRAPGVRVLLTDLVDDASSASRVRPRLHDMATVSAGLFPARPHLAATASA